MAKIVVGIVGPIASGKGTVAKILAEKGYATYSLSDRIREEIKERGQEVTRDMLNMVSNELRGKLGADIWAKRTADLIAQDNPENIVIDSIRNPEEVKFLQQRFGAKIIGIIGDQKRRYELFQARGTNFLGINNWEEFKALDDKELVQTGDHKQQVAACLEMADIIIENNGTVEDLKQKVESFISSLY
jgi:dephospho-CoA kinase